MIPYGKQIINQDDINAVIEALKSPLITQGNVVPEFEKAISNYCNVKYSVAVNSGTAALHIACLSLGVGNNDLVWTTPITFVASANCALYCGAKIDFVDVEYDTGNMSVEALEKKLKTSKVKPKVVIVVHLAGMPANMQKIYQLSQQYGFKIIEDACHALGANYKNSKIGSCKYSDITVFSFHPVKVITTGEGGMAVTNDPLIYQKLKLFGCHGITRDHTLMENNIDGNWYYEQLELGYNYRLSDINAALGLSQLKNLDNWVKTRNIYAKYYTEKLEKFNLGLPPTFLDRYCAFHLYIIKVPANKRKSIFEKLRSDGIGTNVHYIPVYHQPYYQKLENFDKLEETEKFYSEILTLPLCPAITIKDIDFVIEKLTDAL